MLRFDGALQLGCINLDHILTLQIGRFKLGYWPKSLHRSGGIATSDKALRAFAWRNYDGNVFS
jgi:hypothetical protein